MTVPVVLSIAGAIALLVGVLGGGIKAKEIEIPAISSRVRLIASVIGTILVGAAIWLSLSEGMNPGADAAQSVSTPSLNVQLTPTIGETALPTDTLQIPTPTVAQSQQPYKVIVDTRHTQEDTFETLRTSNLEGFVFTKSGQNAWTLDSLLSYDALVINFAWYPESVKVEQFTPVEIQAVREYLDQGGNVLLIGLAWVWKAYQQGTIEDYPLNQIAAPYGITFNTDSYACPRNEEDIIVINSSLMQTQHPIANGLSLLASGPGNAVSDLTAISPADNVISCTKSSSILATLQTPKGRLAALSGGTFIFKNLDSTQYNNYELLKNLLYWLVTR